MIHSLRIFCLLLVLTTLISCGKANTPPSTAPTTSSDSVQSKVHKIIAELLKVDVGELRDSHTFRGDLGTDELDEIELIMEYEDEFNISIADEDAEQLKTIGDVVKYIESRLSQ